MCVFRDVLGDRYRVLVFVVGGGEVVLMLLIVYCVDGSGLVMLFVLLVCCVWR